MAAPAGRTRTAAAGDAVLGPYLDALVAGDLSGAQRVLDDALEGGASPRRLYLDVLQPALYEVGRRWSRAEISVAQEHLATAASERAMARLAGRLSERWTPRGTVVVACPEDELHALGARMVADFLEADGWTVRCTGAMTPSAGIAAVAEGADAVALSVSLPERIEPLTRAVAALHALPDPPFVLVGGQAFAGSAQRGLSTGADAYAADAEGAVHTLRERFAA